MYLQETAGVTAYTGCTNKKTSPLEKMHASNGSMRISQTFGFIREYSLNISCRFHWNIWIGSI